MRSVSIRKQTTTRSTVSNQFIFFWHYIYCISTFLWQKLIKENHRSIKINAQHKENRICQNRIVCSNLTILNTSVTPKVLTKKYDLGNLYINLLQKELAFYHVLVIFNNYLPKHKVSVFFSKIKQLSPKKILLVLLGTNTN